jgi:4-hydroxybenzoate polyprenyltransferase
MEEMFHGMSESAASESARSTSARLPAIVRAVRPLQWTKNGLVLAPIVFADRAFDLQYLVRAIGAALLFCAISSGIYLINDIRDAEGDRHHPKKRLRPIASGELSPRTAGIVAALLLGLGLLASLLIRPALTGLFVAYIALMIAYSMGLKTVVILDVFAIAAGFVMRAAAGAIAISVPISPWLYVCTMLGALFIGFGKRRNELTTLEHLAGRHRANLDAYSVQLLDQIIGIVASAMVMTYSIYTFESQYVPADHSMMLTIPFVLYALFRYLYLLYRRQLGGSPEVLLVTDRPLFLCILGWGMTSVVILYLA